MNTALAVTLPLTFIETLKWLSPLPILVQNNDSIHDSVALGMVTPPPLPHTHTPPPPPETVWDHGFFFSDTLRPQKSYGLLGTGEGAGIRNGAQVHPVITDL